MEMHSPESAGMSSPRLARIDPIMEDFVNDNHMPGILTLIQRGGRIVHLGQYGLMNSEAGTPIQEDALFRIYSMTKPIVSVASMILLEEGRLNLNDPVSKFIPAFKNTKVYAGTAATGMKLVEQDPEMTIYHLLTHTAGLSYGAHHDSPVEALYRELSPAIFHRDQTLAEVIDRLAELPVLYQPGTSWRYSHATDVLGHVVQIIADMPLADFLKARIFEPLGMVDTDFYVPAEKAQRLAQIYTSGSDGRLIAIPPDKVGLGDVTRPTSCPAGGAGLVSTLADYLAFCDCLLNQGAYAGGRLLGRKTVAWMTADHIPQALKPLKMGATTMDVSFGLGFRVTTSLGEKHTVSSVGEYGWSGAAKTYFWIDPAEQLIGLLMVQYIPPDPYAIQERFRNLVYQAIVD